MNTQEYLAKHEKALLNAEKVTVSPWQTWIKDFEKKAGVYAVFDGSNLIYIGETGNMLGRMKDLRRTVNHSLRRHIGLRNYGNHRDFEPASSNKKFPFQFEEALDAYFEEKITVSFIYLDLGRKELEEYLTEKYADTLLNLRRKRK